MQTVTDAAALRATIRGWRSAGQIVGFVPTMGNLHEGHHSLLKLARARADRVVASVFVNPTQFGPGEDFERYPRTLAQDQVGLAEAGCDVLFAPEVATMYPFGAAGSVSIHVPGVTETLEGAHRPGHFDGVATVVSKLFHLVQPDFAVFGQKDFQQLKVIERMVRDLSLPVKIMSGPTLRDEDGLAKSSRNQYLTPAERQRAPQIYATLTQMRDLFRQGHNWQALEQAARARLERAGFVPDYVAIRRADDLAEPGQDEREGLVALVAARLGATRLIDNLPFD
ncbi:pantoate--beta-alanine ligase [Luteibacter aegosomaticola]|uniref:pantoate--beta-alanine ligase n=1 Tax=Luteibacter aegosomaticola TaxID=2911538 RepID=UPI001FFC12AE|nr:pantoate--beta-alanine ligase [Luteibacter aegosomaticola]UPG88671.1 pantoate--beta-alanine ligase [Luteibacter aegosomaticola]